MENSNLRNEKIAPHQKLKAFFLGALSQQYNTHDTINETKLNKFQGEILEFKEKIRETHSQEELDGSESYHMLSGSSVQEEKRITPDPLFDEVDNFVRNHLALLS